MGKSLKKIRKKVAKFDLGHQAVKKMGLPDPSGDALYGSDKALSPTEAAQKAAADQAKETMEQTAMMDEQNRKLQQTIQNNMAQDLRGDNLSNVVAGGTAETFADEPTNRKRRAGGLTSALGV